MATDDVESVTIIVPGREPVTMTGAEFRDLPNQIRGGSMAKTAEQTQAFDTKQFAVHLPEAPIPEEVTDVDIAVKGRVDLRLADPSHQKLLEKLKLGEPISIICDGEVKGHAYKHLVNEEGEASLVLVLTVEAGDIVGAAS